MRAAALAAARRSLVPMTQTRTFIPESINGRRVIDEKYPEPPRLTEAEDPLQNGGFVMPAPVKRQFRDPYGDWWDKQERRNYGEPVHEDYDQLGMFTPYEYTWTTTGKGLAQIGMFIAAFLTVVYTVKQTYPDRVTVPRTFEDGLERELGGPGALRVSSADDSQEDIRLTLTNDNNRHGVPPTRRLRRHRSRAMTTTTESDGNPTTTRTDIDIDIETDLDMATHKTTETSGDRREGCIGRAGQLLYIPVIDTATLKKRTKNF